MSGPVLRPATVARVLVARSRADVGAVSRLRREVEARGEHPGEGAVIDLDRGGPDARALDLLAVEDGRPVATMRVVTAAPGEELPLDGAAGLRRDRARPAAELFAPVPRPDGAASPSRVLGLLRVAFDEVRRAGAEEIYLGADQPLLTMLRGRGFRFRALAGPAWVSGAWTIVAALAVVDVLPGLRLHQAVHGCSVADFFAGTFTGALPGGEICSRAAG